MSSAEYLAVAGGLIAAWAGLQHASDWLMAREQNLIWAFSIPF